jgi:hypothetical protein
VRQCICVDVSAGFGTATAAPAYQEKFHPDVFTRSTRRARQQRSQHCNLLVPFLPLRLREPGAENPLTANPPHLLATPVLECSFHAGGEQSVGIEWSGIALGRGAKLGVEFEEGRPNH